MKDHARSFVRPGTAIEAVLHPLHVVIDGHEGAPGPWWEAALILVPQSVKAGVVTSPHGLWIILVCFDL